MDNLLFIPIIIILVSLNAFYVAAEFATVAARKTRISQLAENGNTMARWLMPVLTDGTALDKYVATSQIGITISSLLLGLYGQSVLAEGLATRLQLSESFASFVAVETLASIIILALITTLQVLLGELLPKSVAIQFPEQVALALAVPMVFSVNMLRPLIWLFNGSAMVILRLFGVAHKDGHAHIHSPQEIEILVTESHEGGFLDAEERQMLRNAFRLRELTAKRVMIHRTRMVSAPLDASVAEILQLSIETGKSRIPLYAEDIDKIKGFVHMKDVFRLHAEGATTVESVLRKVVHVPESLAASDVWETLRKQRQYVAIVFDEFGGTAGLVTLEDLIEEIFGELQDESDNETALLYIGEKGRLRFRWDWLVSDINEYFDLELPEDTDSISGLVISKLGRPAKAGDAIDLDGTLIRVEEINDKGIEEVSITDPGRPKLQDAKIFKLFSEAKEESNE